MHFDTEAEWLACKDPRGLAWHCKDRNDEFRFRLLLVRWGERVRSHLLPDEATFFAAVSEWATTGGAKPRFERNVAGYLSRIGDTPHDAVTAFVGELSRYWLIYAMAAAAIAAALESGRNDDQVTRQFCDEFRDVAGNPFRPVAFDPAWRSETVVGLAIGIAEDGAYERLPILADALEEAGCTEPQVLSHARMPGVHVRGCWLIDMVLGRWG